MPTFIVYLLLCQTTISVPAIATLNADGNPEIARLEQALQDSGPQESDAAAIELMHAAARLSKKSDSLVESLRVAENIYMSSAPAVARRSAYALLDQYMPGLVAQHSKVIHFNGPHTTCWGRFHDALNDRLLGNNEWIMKAKVTNTHVQRNPKALGTVAALEFAIDKSHSPKDLLEALKDSGFDVRGWTVFVEVPATSLITATEPASENSANENQERKSH
ncbi:MAG: hypothetical protein ACE361_21035 [Aureliella sp.]